MSNTPQPAKRGAVPLRESLRRKRSSRMAAVQGIYSLLVSDHTPTADHLFHTLNSQWKDSIATRGEEWPSTDLPEQTLLRDLLNGVIAHQSAMDERLADVIKSDWRPERMDPVMRAILYCALYELDYKPERKAPMLLDEYVSIASGYFDDPELGYIHSALQQITGAAPRTEPEPDHA